MYRVLGLYVTKNLSTGRGVQAALSQISHYCERIVDSFDAILKPTIFHLFQLSHLSVLESIARPCHFRLSLR